jgi:hypothetical protein
MEFPMDFSRFQVQAVDAAIGMGDGIGIGSNVMQKAFKNAQKYNKLSIFHLNLL